MKGVFAVPVILTAHSATFEDAPKNSSAHTTEDATEEENVDVVGQERGA